MVLRRIRSRQTHTPPLYLDSVIIIAVYSTRCGWETLLLALETSIIRRLALFRLQYWQTAIVKIHG